jgi:hypothetical protein
MLYRVLLTISVLLPALASAEYRAYILKITDTKTKQARTIQSTLDPDQYPGYYQVLPYEKVEIAETWMCRGRTDPFLPICPNPKNLTGEKANSLPPAP